MNHRGNPLRGFLGVSHPKVLPKVLPKVSFGCLLPVDESVKKVHTHAVQSRKTKGLNREFGLIVLSQAGESNQTHNHPGPN